MNQKYNVILIIFILILFLYKGVFINILSYINLITHNNTDASSSEVNLLKQNIDNLTKDLEELKDNYTIEVMIPLDMNPYSAKVETVVKLVRK